MDWVTLKPESEYLQIVAKSQRVKRELDTDGWQTWLPENPAQQGLRTVAGYMVKAIDDLEIGYDDIRRYLADAALNCYAASLVEPVWARQFKGISESRIDEVLQSFAFMNCVPNEGLAQVIARHTSRPA